MKKLTRITSIISYFICFTSVLFSLNGCGSSSKNSEEKIETNQKSTVIYEEHFSETKSLNENLNTQREVLRTVKKIISEAKIACLNPKDCAPGIAGLLAYEEKEDSYQLGQCTAVFIGPDLILTNNHCIPKEVKAQPKKCTEQVTVILPEIKNIQKAEHLQCKDVVFLSEKGDDGAVSSTPDYALLRLENSSQTRIYPVRFDGIGTNNSFYSYKINPIEIKANQYPITTGVIQKVECISDPVNVITPGYNNAFSKVVTLAECSTTVIQGNSGSPIFNFKNEVVGLIHGCRIQGEFHKASPYYPKEVTNLAFGTNLACAKELRSFFGIKDLIPAQCFDKVGSVEFSNSEFESILNDAYFNKLTKQKETQQVKRNGILSSQFQWKLRLIKKDTALFWQLHNQSTSFKKNLLEFNYFIELPYCYTKIDNLQFESEQHHKNIFLYQANPQLNQNLQVEAVLQPLLSTDLILTLFKQNGKVFGKTQLALQVSAQTKPSVFEIPECQ